MLAGRSKPSDLRGFCIISVINRWLFESLLRTWLGLIITVYRCYFIRPSCGGIQAESAPDSIYDAGAGALGIGDFRFQASRRFLLSFRLTSMFRHLRQQARQQLPKTCWQLQLQSL